MAKKVKKKKIKILPCLILLIVLVFLYLLLTSILKMKTNNIYIIGNELLKDQEIIDMANLSDYPSFFKTSPKKIKESLEKNELIKNVKVERKLFNVFKITIEENKVILYDESEDKFILSNGKKVSSDYKVKGLPVLLNYISDKVYDNFISSFSQIDISIREHISEIKYDPSSYDETRFLFYMNDGNFVYINTANIESMKYYDKIYPNLDGKKGILYLDSGYGEASQFKILD